MNEPRIMTRSTYLQIMKRCDMPHNRNFYKFLKSREYLKRSLFMARLYHRAWHINKRFAKDEDHFTVVCGGEGSGKSTLAIQFCSTVSPTFSQKHICYEMKDFLNCIKICKPNDSILLDEGGMFLFSREAMGKTNRTVTKLFMLIRQLNLHICICIPMFKTIDKYIRDHRIGTLINIPKKSECTVYINEAIPRISQDISKKPMQVNQVRVQNGTFEQGHFNKDIPEINDITPESYRELKMQHLQKFVDATLKEIDVSNKELKEEHNVEKTELIPMSFFAKKTPYSAYTLRDWIKEGKLKGKVINGKYFVHRDELQKFSII